MVKYFVIADTHFGHAHVIDYCNRPFKDINDMNFKLVKFWNETVSNGDYVFMLGDFAFGKENVRRFANELNGRKILIKGNHDTYPNSFYRECGFEEVSKYPILFEFCLMSHEPLLLSQTTPYFNFYGHIHQDERYIENATSKCVSVERINYRPYCFLEK